MARTHKRQRKQHSAGRLLRRALALVFVCFAFLALCLAVFQSASVGFAQQRVNGSCVVNNVQGDHTVTVWSKLRSTQSADVLNAIKCTPMFQNAQSGSDLIGEALRKGSLAAPYLVKPYRRDSGLAQVWVVPVVDQNQIPLALLSFIYDPAQQSLRESEFAAVTGNMFYATHHFPAVTPVLASSSVVTGHHVQMLAGRAPELVYFPGDFEGFKAGKHHWNSGGTTPIDPVWRVPGADGHWHYVDHDGKAHLNNEIPVETDMPAMPADNSNS